jgi:hypothetical protein
MMSDVDSYPDYGLTRWLADQHHKPAHAAPGTFLRKLARDATSWDLRTRLAMRTHPVFHLTGFRHRVQKLAFDLARARDLTRNLDLASELTGDLTRAGARHRAHDLTRGVTRACHRARDLSSDLDRARDLTRGLDPVRAVVLDLVRAVEHVIERAHARDRALADAHAFGLTLTYNPPTLLALGVGLSFTHALNLVRDRDRELYRALTLAHDRALSADHALDRALDRDGTTKALMELHNVLSDVTGLDLRRVDLAGIALRGLRWSVGTRWPPRWVDQIRRESVEVADGIFQIVNGGTEYALTQA